MNQKCYLCNNDGSKIFERPNGYDGNHVNCPQCTNYKITRNAIKKIMQRHQVPASLSSTVRSHFETTGNLYEVDTVKIDLSN